MMAMTAGATMSAALDPDLDYKFALNSPLRTGRWVCISIGESGIYEISYEQLLAMGFSDPSKVTVFGAGGAKREVDLLRNGYRVSEDTAPAVRVMHKNDKLYFYGQGTVELALNYDAASEKLSHRYTSTNIYTDRAHYLLTDSQPVLAVETLRADTHQGAEEKNTGYGCYYYEKDLTQGPYGNVGQVFWGEALSVSSPFAHTVELPYCVAGAPSVLSGRFVVQNGLQGNLQMGLNNVYRQQSLSRSVFTSTDLDNSMPDCKLTVDSDHIGRGTVEFKITGCPEGVYLALDNWSLTYPLSLIHAGSDPGFTQQYAAFAPTGSSLWRHPVPENMTVWDVTSPLTPTALEVDRGYFYHTTPNKCRVIAFDTAKPQMQIGDDARVVANQDLHALQTEPIDMVIFTTDGLESYARRIAALHESLDGQKVAVVRQQQAYDEFTDGNPDPLAYRMIAKMLYQNPTHRLKNVLLMGPIFSDYRNIRNVYNRPEGHIAYQQSKADYSKHPACVMDYYGFISDRTAYSNSLESDPINVGVGLLPISSDEEGELAVAKVREYLEKQDFSGIVNEIMTIGLNGDSHIHDNQAAGIGNLFQQIQREVFGSKFAWNNIWIEGVGLVKAPEQIHQGLNRGKLLTTYFGHADIRGFGGFTAKDVLNMENPELGFLFLGACDLMFPDNNQHGVGDMGVIRAKRGLMGCIASTRQVMSNFNENLAQNFVRSLFQDFDNSVRTSSPTIGEAYARSKDRSNNESEICYMLIGDPALKMPVALGKVEVSIDDKAHRAGEVVTVTGRLTDTQGNLRSDYNGYATLKLMEPPVTIPATDDKMVPFEFNDLPMHIVKTEVRNGEFSVNLLLPEGCNRFMSADAENTTKLPLLVGTYDPTTRLGASGVAEVALDVEGSAAPDDMVTDTEAPQVSVTYDNTLRTLSIAAADNVALLPGVGAGCGVSVAVDGENMSVAHEYSDGVTVQSYNTALSVGRLAAGRHTVTYSAADVAGNRLPDKTLEFEISDVKPLELTADRNVAVGEITFTTTGYDGNDLTLTVTDPAGNIAAGEDAGSGNITLDTTGLRPGVYRACMRHESARGAIINSNWVEFTVID